MCLVHRVPILRTFLESEYRTGNLAVQRIAFHIAQDTVQCVHNGGFIVVAR